MFAVRSLNLRISCSSTSVICIGNITWNLSVDIIRRSLLTATSVMTCGSHPYMVSFSTSLYARRSLMSS